ncbi:ribulokinase [Rhizobiales bacterium RZME27]|uniref:Ribulokinase n=1 Tax=Endobacterium cereale TaxID=2663029 RepID=A0A6A8AIX4_9HYPH|nr:FGGY-family carbohydrate kinase [Endobacterium cereale]MEB2847336.1 FGGY-family carbohydrate kinase [Endobacterium cereale]MQY49186.1 ribulokinase [Endobacterium cereale]
MNTYFIGIDVGTGSARAGVFDVAGTMLATARHDITVFRDDLGHVEQSSAEIWDAVCASVRDAVAKAEIDAASVVGLGFDATCSLVVEGASAGIGDPAHPERDIIVWMDHRAIEQARRINATGHTVLSYVGGVISPEMETPKLLWLKENRPEVYASAKNFFDLTDFLTWKSTGALERSSCTVTCKWTYLAHEDRWDESYFREIGLEDLAEEGFLRIGQRIVHPGTPLGNGLNAEAAAAMGLRPGTAVAAGLIDAHAGGIGTVAARGGAQNAKTSLGYVFGTSSCTMTTTAEPKFVPGVWGPYYSAMVPGMWLNEGGQSAAGAAIDQLLSLHPQAEKLAKIAKAEGLGLPQWLAKQALATVGQPSDVVGLAGQLQVLPEFLGNRAPFADPSARAAVMGLGIESGPDSLVALYVAGLCGLGYGLRQIIDTQVDSGVCVATISVSGGAGTHPLTRQILADATGLSVEVTACPEPVLLGSAMLAAVAAKIYPDLQAAMPAMSSVAGRNEPTAGAVRALHEARYQAFLKTQKLAREMRENIEPLLAAVLR